jgi:hypothetical protein
MQNVLIASTIRWNRSALHEDDLAGVILKLKMGIGPAVKRENVTCPVGRFANLNPNGGRRKLWKLCWHRRQRSDDR